MKLILPILFFALFIGLFVRRMTPLVWGGVALWVLLFITRAYFRPI